jgi:UDP-2,3-diacylglucosamine hydrolase
MSEFISHSITLSDRQKVYFLSDFHLGVPDAARSLKREQAIVNLLQKLSEDAKAIFLLGDVFDFWFEYRNVVPKGFTRLLATLSAITAKGIEVHYFTGNHDIWVFDYIPSETGVKLHRDIMHLQIGHQLLVIGHGDGLGPGDHGFKFMKKLFTNKICQRLFSWLHPDIGIPLARFWSGKSRGAMIEEEYLGDDKEWLVQFCKVYSKNHAVDYYIFGHRHLYLNMMIDERSRYINLGEWFKIGRYAAYDGKDVTVNEWAY